MSDEASLSYRFGDQICNERFDTRLGETLCSEVTSRSRAPASCVDDGVGPGRLRFEPTNRDLGSVSGNAVALEVVGDQQVTGASARKERRPARGESPVVDQPCTLDRLERLPSHSVSGTPVGEPPLERGHRVVASSKRTQCFTLRLETP